MSSDGAGVAGSSTRNTYDPYEMRRTPRVVLAWGAAAIVGTSIVGAVALTIAEDLSGWEGLGPLLSCAANLALGFALAAIVARPIRPKVERTVTPDH
jgi:hypothetical protein